jgi:hypothetical protein
MFFVTNLDTRDGYILAFMCNYALFGGKFSVIFPGFQKYLLRMCTEICVQCDALWDTLLQKPSTVHMENMVR